MQNKIAIIGSGNVATHLAQVFFKNKQSVSEIYSRNEKEGKILAKSVNAKFISKITEIGKNSEVIIMAISDDAIAEVSKNLNIEGKILAHTSGITNTEILSIATQNVACFYPLQTFTKGHLVDFKQIPILITSNNQKSLSALKAIAYKISKKVKVITDLERQKLHLSAVIVNNFTNHLFTLSSKYLTKNKIDFDLLKPLIQETANKISTSKPNKNQTGPAKRNDMKTIEKHLSFIEDNDLKEIYKILTKSIYNTYND